MEALMGTAHDACSRKVHASAKGYFKDPFAVHFQRDTTIVNSPLMNRGHWLRVKAVENTLKNFAKLYPGEAIQVVSLGAGVDTLYFKWAADKTLESDNTINISRYLEIDFGPLVEEKLTAIKRSSALSELVTGEFESVYKCVESDLCNHDEFIGVCTEHLNPTAPTLFIAECVFVYIDSDKTTALLNWINNEYFGKSEKVMLFTYDAMGPNDRFGQMMLQNLSERGIFLKGITGIPDLAAHTARAQDVGFKSIKAMSMKQLYFSVHKETQTVLNKIEMIDDWDEWNLVHEHYCIMVAWKGGDGSVPPVFGQ